MVLIRDDLNPEAISINGVFIEDVIEGFRVLSVSGRELADIDYSTERYGGSFELTDLYQSPRLISVRFFMKAPDSATLTSRFNDLNKVFDFTDAKIQVNDEPDKFYKATKVGTNNIPQGVLKFTSTFDIICTDPHKYSTAEKTATASVNEEGVLSVTLQNDGSVAAPISYKIENVEENGYIGVVSDQGAAQLGDAQEVDGVIKTKSQRVIRDTGAAGTGLQTLWTVGSGYAMDTGRVFTGGTMKHGQPSDPPREYRVANSYGTGTAWHGAIQTRKFSPDSNGDVGGKNFTANFRNVFMNSKSNEVGLMGIVFANSDGTRRIGMQFHKDSTTNNNFMIKIYTSGFPNQVEDKRINVKPRIFKGSNKNTRNDYTDFQTGIFKFRKTGREVFVTAGGKNYTFISNAIADIVFDNVSIYSMQYGTKPVVFRQYWDYVYVHKDYIEYESETDFPNAYDAGSVITVDKGLNFFYNPMKHPDSDTSLEGQLVIPDVVGSVWTKALPGETNIEFYYSDFVTTPPNITVTFTEAYI